MDARPIPASGKPEAGTRSGVGLKKSAVAVLATYEITAEYKAGFDMASGKEEIYAKVCNSFQEMKQFQKRRYLSGEMKKNVFDEWAGVIIRRKEFRFGSEHFLSPRR